jgi:hypothetical protein
MFSIEEFIIAIYCCVDEELKVLTQGRSTRSRGFEPKLSDAKVLTMEIVVEFQGIGDVFQSNRSSRKDCCGRARLAAAFQIKLTLSES